MLLEAGFNVLATLSMKKHLETAAQILLVVVFGFVIIGNTLVELNIFSLLPVWSMVVSTITIIIIWKLRAAQDLLYELAGLLPGNSGGIFIILFTILFWIGVVITAVSILIIVPWCDHSYEDCYDFYI